MLVNVALYVARRAEEAPTQDAVIVDIGKNYQRINYAELALRVDALARGLRAWGVQPGTKVALLVKPGIPFFVAVFALFQAGCVLVAVDPGLGLGNIRRCLDEAAPELCMGIPLALWVRKLGGWAKKSISRTVAVGPRFTRITQKHASLHGLCALGATQPALTPINEASAPAAILFTSGSTGAPKGVCYTHGNFAAQVDALRALFHIEPGEVDLATFPLFALFAPALGMTAVVPRMDFTRPGQVNPEAIRRPIVDCRVTNCFGSPALLRRVGLQAQAQRWRFPGLKRVNSAGAPVPEQVLRLWRGLVCDRCDISTPYGATEALPVACIESRLVLGETAALARAGQGTCVGLPVPGLRVAIIPVSDAPIAQWDPQSVLPAGALGEICVQGGQVTAAYHARPEANALAKIPDPAGGFWHRMGDLGHLDAQGRLWFAGRKSQRVTTALGDLFTEHVEPRVNAIAGVARSALVGVGPCGAQEPVLCIEVEAQYSARAVQQTVLDALPGLGLCSPMRAVLVHPQFPVDIRHNAKIGREALARWAAERL